MTVQHIGFREAREEPWANGAGMTRELLRWPKSGQNWDWRVSVADVVQAGMFSSMPGIDRTIALCEGKQLQLTVDGVTSSLSFGQPFDFLGESQTYCEVAEGPTRDLNIMTRRATTSSRSSSVAIDGYRRFEPVARHTVVIAISEGLQWVDNQDSRATVLNTFDVVHRTGQEPVTIRGVGLALIADLGARIS